MILSFKIFHLKQKSLVNLKAIKTVFREGQVHKFGTRMSKTGEMMGYINTISRLRLKNLKSVLQN